jgi:hypothetical protein
VLLEPLWQVNAASALTGRPRVPQHDLLVETARVAFCDIARGVQFRRELNARDDFLSHLLLVLRDVLKENC